MNTFRLNQKAMQLLGLAAGEKIALLDFGTNAPNQETRFFCCKDFVKGGESQGAVISKLNGFTYSKIYGAMLANDPEVISISPASLIEKGLMYPKAEGKASQYVAAKKATADITLAGEGEVADGVYRELYLINNFLFTDHTPREGAEDENDGLSAEELAAANVE
jgi:hypothetical protein